MDNYIQDIGGIRQQLKTENFAVPNKIVALVSLHGFNDSWGGFITATTQSMRHMDVKDIKPKKFINQVLDGDRRRNPKKRAHRPKLMNSTMALCTQSVKRPRMECSHCHRAHQTAETCWTK